MKDVRVKLGTKVKVADFEGEIPEGKRFLAWSTEPEGKGRIYKPGQTVTLSGDLTLYPVWGDAVETAEPEGTE